MRTATYWATGVRFLGEQDGLSEQKLKLKLSVLLTQTGKVEKAYLAYVEFEPASLGTGVALCLWGKRANRDLFEAVYRIFAELFDAQEHLSVLLIDDKQESELAEVCRPFFVLADSH